MTAAYKNRFDWVDWMKALGIFLVVLGHFYSIGEKFIYVFHVPLFFIISGFLTKKESDNRQFLRKLWYNLAVPMLIIATLNVMFDWLFDFMHGTFNPMEIYWFVRNVVFGMVSGFDALWFVYTLILLKIFFQYSFSNRCFGILAIVMLVLTYVYNHMNLSVFPFFLREPNSIVNTLTACPFFALGVFFHNFRGRLKEWNRKILLMISFFCCLLIVVGCYYHNGYVAMYCCCYGENVFLFLIGGVAGSIMIFSITKLLGPAPKVVVIVSRGTIVILGFHKLLIGLVREFFSASYNDVFYSALIILFFVPTIIFLEKYFPLMIGKYRIIKK